MDTRDAAFIEQNLGLVRLCANRFRGKGIEYEDMYSAGCIGLLKAAKAFDDSRGVRFSTYAVPVILGEIKRLFRDGGTIKIQPQFKGTFTENGQTSRKNNKRNGQRAYRFRTCRRTLLNARNDSRGALRQCTACFSHCIL